MRTLETLKRMFGEYLDVSVLIGKTLIQIDNNDNEEIIFHTDEGEYYGMYHEQDCCEEVLVEDVIGELSDLLKTPILMAEEVTEEGESEWGTATWTFYKFATINGYVTIRWFGESNGYYSESVYFKQLEGGKGAIG